MIEQLNAGLYRKLTLISAAAGFGKTTLVSEWGAGVERPVAWLSLDEGDSDPMRFLTYLIAAIQTVQAGVGEGALTALQSPHPPPPEAILTVLLNEIAVVPDAFILVLDDYHVIDAKAVDAAIAFLLEHLPAQIHLVIATREDPGLHLARLRVRQDLTEIRAHDLRFTSAEAAQFFNQAMGLSLSTEEITALENRTEGWIAGLQLAAISMQGYQERGRTDVGSFIQSFTGSHHFVMDYLIEEVLQQQPKSVQTFLLHTSVLNRLSGPLCDAVTGQNNGQTTLEMLDHDNLFIVPLDEERHWYRYHHLFADLLQQRVQQLHHEQISTIHQRASLWYEQNEFAGEAIEHALRAEDFGRAGQLIEIVAEAVWLSGVDTRLRRWLARLPADLLLTNPRLSIFHAWYLLAGGDQDKADRVLTTAALAIARIEGGATDAAPQGRLATIQAFSAFYRGDAQAIIQHARHALEYLPAQDLSWRSTATHLLADAYDFSGNIKKAYHFRLAAVQASKASGNVVQILIANLKLAINLRYQGRLQEAIEICQQQQAFANESGMAQTVLSGWLLAIWGETLAEIDDLDGAIHQASQGVALCEAGGDLAMLGWSYICLIRVFFTRGELIRAQEVIHRLANLERVSFVPPWITNLNVAWQARVWLAQDKLEMASQWVEERGLDANQASEYQRELECIVFARILIAQGQLDEANTLLQDLHTATEKTGRSSRAIEILLLLALASQSSGDVTMAMTALEQALILAEPGGFIRIFVDEGAAIAELLLKAGDAGMMPQYVDKLLTAFQPNVHESADMPASPLIEPLSQRELEVLQLIAQGLSNREIGAQLFLSLNTIKGHNRNIFGKLQVQRRTEAIARAREVGLL